MSAYLAILGARFRMLLQYRAAALAGLVRVLVEFSDGRGSWGVVGVHRNIVAASWEALTSGVVIGLLRHREAAGQKGDPALAAV